MKAKLAQGAPAPMLSRHKPPNTTTGIQHIQQEQPLIIGSSNSSSTHLQANSEKQRHTDGKRTLIKNQLYLIEQLQLENANLRNERDQLQLENEELKFQLQMIDSSNILVQPGGSAFANHEHDDQHQMAQKLAAAATTNLPTSTSDATTTNCHSNMTVPRSYAPNPFASAAAPAPGNAIGKTNCNQTQKIDNAVVTSCSGLAQIAATPLRQPMRTLQADNQYATATGEKNNFTSCRRTTSNSELALACQDRTCAGPAQGVAATLLPFGAQPQQNSATHMNENKYLTSRSGSIALLNVGSAVRPTATLLGSSSVSQNDPANQDAEDNGEARALMLVCRRLKVSDSDKVLGAAIVIQRAFRRHQICKRFRVITEQLRHACKWSAPSSCNTSPSQSDPNDDQEIPYASGTTRAAAWESLSLAASRLAASAAAKKAILARQQRQQQQQQQQPPMPRSRQLITSSGQHRQHSTVTKSASSMQINRMPNAQQQRLQRLNGDSAHLKSSESSSVVAAALSFQQLEALRKRQYRVGLNIFNKNPEKGISFLIAHSFIDCSSPFAKSSTSYYLANQLHFIDKQNLAQQQTILAQQTDGKHTTQHKQQQQQQQEAAGNKQATCQMCQDEKNLKRNIAHFLLHRKGLAKEKIGQYLGNLRADFNQDVLQFYLQELDFFGLQVDLALRKFSSTLRMPGEAQKIERFVDCFAERYVQCQQQSAGGNGANSAQLQLRQQQQQQPQTPLKTLGDLTEATQANINPSGNNLTLLSRDEIFILTFAIIMLNTDLHSPSLKSQARMSGQQFVHNLRGVFKSQTIQQNDLLEIYERVKANQITTAPDHVSHVMKVQQGLTVNNFQKKDSIPNLCVAHRRLVCFCRLFEVYDVNKKERTGQHQREIFLFNDMLLVTKLARRARTNSPQQYTYRQSIPLQGLYVQLFQSTHYNFGIRLCRRSNDDTLIMFNARNELDQSRFVDDLSESIAEMEEMEIIRAHNIVDAIHLKHQERLRRHSMMHEMQAATAAVTLPTVGDGTENDMVQVHHQTKKHNINETFVVSAGKLTSGLSALSFANGGGTRERAVSNDKLVLLEDNGEQDELATVDDYEATGEEIAVHELLVNKENITIRPGRRLQSKFNSMSNLSSVSENEDFRSNGEGGNDQRDRRKDVNNATAAGRQMKQTAPATAAAGGLRLNRSFIKPLRYFIQASNGNQQPLVRVHQKHTNGQLQAQPSDRLSANQRSSSTASVRSLDSGLFLSRDVSPNQSG